MRIVPLSVVIAPDSFKGSLSARDAAEAIAAGWRLERPDDAITLIPQADGGEGTIDAIEASSPHSVRHYTLGVTGPDGRPTTGEWLELPGAIAVVELAQMSGLPLMHEPNPLAATTRGLGETIAAALASGPDSLIIGLGGSAATDGGAGALAALGLRMMDAAGTQLPDGGGPLATLATIALDGLLSPPPGGVTLLTDVDAPLLGPSGAAAIFGPQKGASPADIILLETALGNYAQLLGGDPSQTGVGAAGGTAYGFVTAWGARVIPGAPYIAERTGLARALGRADLVITGEGKFDEQSRGGKVVGHVLDIANASETKVGVIAGQLVVDLATWSSSLATLAGSAKNAMVDPAHWLRLAGAAAAKELT